MQPKLHLGVFNLQNYSKSMNVTRPHQFRLGWLLFKLAGFAAIVFQAHAISSQNPYEAIAGRNVFALKPPPPPAAVALPPVAPSGIELQGISTILGRPQVLLKIKTPPRPPEPAKDKSVVLDVGQREGDVEILAIDNANGIIKLKNQGNELTLNMKDNAAKPTAGPALPSPILPPAPPQGIPAPVSGSGAAVPPAGAGVSLPTRSLRSNNPENTVTPPLTGGLPSQQQTSEATMQRMEANVALYEANRLKNEELIKAGARIPRMPVHSLLKSSPPADQ